ncbi:MAG: cation-transporting P-type ATPase [Anaerolineaceae bacterium]
MQLSQYRPHWSNLDPHQAADLLQSDPSSGLDNAAAAERITQYGVNSLTADKKVSFWKEFFEELSEPMVLMLLVTGVLYTIWGELSDAITIFAIIFTLNTVEVVNEVNSKKAIASLRKLAEPSTSVMRGGKYLELPVEQLVPGDLVLLQAGHRVPADARLVEAYGLAVDESALTGESLTADKNARELLPEETPLAERSNMVFSSTLVTRGKGSALVVATGMDTEIGRIAGLARQVKEPPTSLQKLMSELSKTLVWFALGFSVLVPLVGILVAHQESKQMLLTGLSLAFATIPEELPIIITMVLSLGAFRLSKKHAIAKRLSGVESLGAVTVIATDKTGTLTENRMEIARLEPAPAADRLLELGVLANDAVAGGGDFKGDPVDAAIFRAAAQKGIDPIAFRYSNTILTEFTFDNERKRMSTVYTKDEHTFSAAKGAPESILAQCARITMDGALRSMTEKDRQEITAEVTRMAAEGLRVIALAERSLDNSSPTLDEAESDLTYVGLIALADPPRKEARDAILVCQRAGIRTILITGDHPLTALAIAKQVGLNGGTVVITGPDLDRVTEEELRQVVKTVSIYARTSPEHKLRIVQALQANGERVAVTGDGINDAPALSAADIGVAMGETGTDVAREAGDLVLADDNFTTIVNAVQEGRLIFENLKKGVRYYLSCKLALVMINLVPTLLLIPVPFAPVQIILMELFMDLMAAAAFSIEKPESDLLDQKPRDPKAKFMDKAMITSLVTSSIGLFAAVTALYLVTWNSTHDLATSQTVAFFSWLVGHVLLAFNMRSEHQPVFQMGLGSNRLMLIWGGVVAVFLGAISVIPGAHQVMRITALNGSQWLMILGAAFIGTFWIEARKLILFRKKSS